MTGLVRKTNLSVHEKQRLAAALAFGNRDVKWLIKPQGLKNCGLITDFPEDFGDSDTEEAPAPAVFGK